MLFFEKISINFDGISMLLFNWILLRKKKKTLIAKKIILQKQHHFVKENHFEL